VIINVTLVNLMLPIVLNVTNSEISVMTVNVFMDTMKFTQIVFHVIINVKHV